MGNSTQALWLALLIGEVVALAVAQRRLFGWMAARFGMRVATVWAAPATVAHELSHAGMALLLGVPFGRRVGGKVELFRPRHNPDGTIQLGVVHVAQTDAIRQTLISIAPVILVPVMLLAFTWALLGTPVILNDPGAVLDVPTWRLALWAFLMLLVPTAAFPSIGDHIGALGAILLLLLAGLLGVAIVETHGADALVGVAGAVARALLIPGIVCAALIALVRPRR